MEGMNLMQHPTQLGMMGKKAMQLGNYPDALRIFSMGLDQVQILGLPPQCAAPFLLDRAECFWRLGDFQASLRDMEESLRRGLPRDSFFAEEESLNWTDHGNMFLRKNDFLSAEKCANFALFFQTSRSTRAGACLCKAFAQYEMGKTTAAKREIDEIKRLDCDVARTAAQQRKDFAIAIFKNKNYERSIKEFDLSLLLHPEDSWIMKFKRSVESHQATAYFYLKNYKKAVELGEACYRTNTSYRSKEEAERWKVRGNQLLSSKEASTLDLVIASYTLALKFTPGHEQYLRATILSNRCLMYKKQGNAEKALKDAQDCVDCKPDWSKAQYRLGSSLFARMKYQEAMKPFSKSLQLLLKDSSSSENDKVDTLTQLLSVALNLPDGTSSVQFNIPQNLIQSVINKAVVDRDWKRLHLLFLGGGGEKQYKKDSGGLAIGCDASSVPLEEVIRNDLPVLRKFINVLLDHKANANPPKGRKSPLDVAIELGKIDVASVLMDRNIKSGAGANTSELPKRMFRSDGLEAVRKGENKKAIKLLQLSLKHDAATDNERRKVLQLLCELYFKEKAFDDCLGTGRKLKETYKTKKDEKDEVQATQWKNWGNELHKEGQYQLMAEYYSLALDFTPESNSETTTALLSNRCWALINLGKFKEALADADKCTKIRPKWFRGYSRRGKCLFSLKRKKEALRAFCKAHANAVTDKEKQATAQEVITTAMSIEGGESHITCTLSPQMLQSAIKEASKKEEWNKLRFLFLGTAGSKTSKGLAYDCDASCVPLDLLIQSDVKDLHKLVTHLLQQGASPTGLRGCVRAPLLVAMEMMKFPLAVTLLRNNADPSCIVGHGIFINREGQPKQWLQLGRKALDANDNKKAILLLNMSLYLSESNTEKSISQQIYHGLSEAHFNLNEHERSVDAGHEYFKLRPIKSEEEATRWKVRAARAFESSAYTFCIDYVNLALKYTPADSKQTFSLLLCRRSQAFQQLSDYERGLEDAKNASMMNPEIFEGYCNQLYCLRALNRGRESMQVINECLKRTSDENTIYDLLSDALDIAVNLQEATSALTVSVPSQLIEKLTTSVIQKRDWQKLRILYLGGGGPTSHPIGDGGLATDIDASSVPLGEIICSTDPEELLLLVAVLLNHGASANAIEGSALIPLDEAMTLQNLALVEKLIHNGANSCLLGKDGEPIIHQALRTGLRDKNGNFRFLEAMLVSKIPEIKNVQNKEGDSLYHLACTGRKSTPNKCKAIRILRDANVNPNLPNKTKKHPIDMLYKSDPRWKMLNTALGSYKSHSSTSFQSETGHEDVSTEEQHQASATKDDDPSGEEEDQSNQEELPVLPKDVESRKTEDKQQIRMQMREKVAGLIAASSPLNSIVPEGTKEDQDENEDFNEPSELPYMAKNDERRLNDVDEILLKLDEDDDANIDDIEIGEGDAEVDIDSKSPFEDLPWEVDCTDRVWKVMTSKKVDNRMRTRIINKIRMLANGRWNKTMCKRLEGVAKKEGIQLYESKLTKSHRIIWEKTIAFSGRCSENPELRLNMGNPAGRIYSDIIRVWDIVLDHDKLQRSIEHIVKSHDRGMDCIIKKKLKGITVETQNDSTSSSECLPNRYAEIADLEQANNLHVPKDGTTKTTASNDLSQIFFPPASSNEQEYHILKFYSFSTALEKTVLESDISLKIDFPFKITELEHAIVNLRPDPPIPIILLGRSGTGKTTCCLYRLWDKFQRYWESAKTAGPHIPRYVPPVRGIRFGAEEALRGAAEEGVGQASSSKDSSSHTLASSQCQQFNISVDPGLASSSEDADHVHTYQSAYPHFFKDENQCEENNPDDVSQIQLYEHLHQVFITKNTVLCSEVERNFKELCHACPEAQHRQSFEDQPIPTKIQDVAEEAWPLFLNSRDWLLMLDASLPGEPFFKRAADGSLLRKIEGWGEEDNHLQFIPATESDDDRSDNEDEEDNDVTGTGKGNRNATGRSRTQGKEERDPRREITYQLFHLEIWPKMKKSSKEKIDYHPTLVWMEIRSFIKGSAEALLSENGVLSLNDYESLGKKKAPNFSADRKIIYDLFRIYQRVHSSNRMFDEADLVFNIHRRLQRIPAPEWSIHQFYVDETQDFTQAELSLLIRCCRFPNNLFFTGDTAQSIMRGIAFRFDDLKSLFHHAKKAAGIKEDHHEFIRVPKKLYQLTHNYRSHAGILRLASSVVDLLLHYFRDSFDKLQKDEGLFEGPKPVLLESCSPADLAMILQGNQRQSSRIEFGAHQVVLVASNEARETMPEELKHGLVMTIYEAKGLEFDDVLIYNFFKDSQAGKEWRVVTTFMEDESVANVSSSTGLVEITEDSVSVQRSRPLEFDPEKHKVLNSEFKYLYTAITRARVNVWLFDEDKESRAPVFEYFQRLGLVKVVAIGDHDEGSGELVNMFAAKSTPEEWRKGGIRFYKRGLWVPAIQCFTFAGDSLMLQKSQAQHQAAEASKLRSTNRQQMRDEFLRAAESFLNCHMYDEAEICLNNAREWVLLAKLYEKTGKFQYAARLFKRKGLYKEASKCYESQNNYAEAIETLCQAGLYEDGLGALERFNILSKSGEERQGIIPPRSTRTVERLRHQLADQHFKEGKTKEMEEILQHLPSTTDRIAFLKKRGCIIEAARALEVDGRRNEAARLLWETGKFEEALKYSTDFKFSADCLMAQVRITMKREDSPRILLALEKYQLCGDINGQAEASLMLGNLSQDTRKLQEAGRLFNKCKNCAGEVESVTLLLQATSCIPPPDYKQWVIVRALERVLRLAIHLFKPPAKLTMAERQEIRRCEVHFGLFKSDDARKVRYFCKSGGRFAKMDPEFVKNNISKTEATMDTAEAHHKIVRFLITSSDTLVAMIRKMLETSFLKNSVCREVTQGQSCDNEDCPYQHNDSEEFFNTRFTALFNCIFLESVVERFISDIAAFPDGKKISAMLMFDDFKAFHACQRFYDFLFPTSGCRKYHLTASQVDNIRSTHAVKQRLFQFACDSWTNIAEGKRRSDTDNFLIVSSCLQIIGSSPFMVRWICEEENGFQRKAKQLGPRLTNEHLVKNGMIERKNESGRFYESYLHWWENGKKRLHVHGNVKDAAHFIIRRFLTLTAKRSGMSYPSIANTVMILEHQMTACLALYSRLCVEHRYPVCLPASYLTVVRLWDNFRPGAGEKGIFTLYEAVDRNASYESDKTGLLKAVYSILNYMTRLTCGIEAPLFDVLGDAIDSEDTGEAERALVLVLTMLCNCGKGISIFLDKVLLENIIKVKASPRLPSHVNTALEEIQDAKGFSDVITTLKKLLDSRGEELYDLRWNNGQLWPDGPSKASRYAQRFRTEVSNLREQLARDQQQVEASGVRQTACPEGDNSENTEILGAAGEGMEVEYTEEELNERESARREVNVNVIKKWYRRMKLAEKFSFLARVLKDRKLRRFESIEEQTESSSNALEEHFAQFKVDSSACGICGTNFQVQKDENLPMGSEDNEEDRQGSNQEMERASPDEHMESAEAHRSTHAHFQKAKEFHHYKELYLHKVYPSLTKEKELRKTLEDPSLAGEKKQVELDLDRLERISSFINNEVQSVESSLNWTNLSSLINELTTFEIALQKTEKIVEQAKADSLKAKIEEAELENEILREDIKEDDGEDEENATYIDITCGKEKVGKSRRRSRKRKR